MRPSQEAPPHPSYTPIYDTLYAEYRKSFRALPGDRSGEEDLGFTGFGSQLGLHHQHGHSGLGSHYGHPHTAPYSPWQNLHTQHGQGRQYSGNHLPAALPPGPRRGY